MRSFLPDNDEDIIKEALADFDREADIQRFIKEKVKTIIPPQSQNGGQKGDQTKLKLHL